MTTLFPIIGLFTLLGLLWSKYQKNERGEWLFKPLTSTLFILTGISGALSQDEVSSYAVIVIIGLILGMGGDVLLIPKSEKIFLIGVITFLLGHVAYVVAFNDLVRFWALSPVVMIIFSLISGGIFGVLRPRLHEMTVPVIAYVVVITLMVFSALAVYFETDYSADFRRLVALGAVCFYFSDLGVAIDRFMNLRADQFYWSLPLYYAGQFMIALSVGLI